MWGGVYSNSDAYACQSRPEQTPPYPVPPPGHHTANGQQMLALIILVLEASGTLTFCVCVKHLTCLTHSCEEDNKPPNKIPRAQYGPDTTEKKRGHRKPDNEERTHEAGDRLDAQGVEAQSVQCLLSTHQALGSILKMA